MSARDDYPRMARWAEGQAGDRALFANEILAALNELDAAHSSPLLVPHSTTKDGTGLPSPVPSTSPRHTKGPAMNPYTERCDFRCPCHEPEWCADNPAVGCDLCRSWHGHLTLTKFDHGSEGITP